MLKDYEFDDDDDYKSDELQNDGVVILKGIQLAFFNYIIFVIKINKLYIQQIAYTDILDGEVNKEHLHGMDNNYNSWRNENIADRVNTVSTEQQQLVRRTTTTCSIFKKRIGEEHKKLTNKFKNKTVVCLLF